MKEIMIQDYVHGARARIYDEATQELQTIKITKEQVQAVLDILCPQQSEHPEQQEKVKAYFEFHAHKNYICCALKDGPGVLHLRSIQGFYDSTASREAEKLRLFCPTTLEVQSVEITYVNPINNTWTPEVDTAAPYIWYLTVILPNKTIVGMSFIRDERYV